MSTTTDTTSKKLFHLQILIKRADHLSPSEFHTYWTESHPKVWLSVPIVKTNVLKYTQFHVDNTVSEGLKAAGLPISEFDGGVNIWGKSAEDIMAVFHDPEYLERVVSDEEKFLKRAEAVLMVGWDEELKGEKE